MSIDAYIATVRAHLTDTGPDTATIAEELRAHLEDAASDLQMGGLDPAQSEREALRRFGASDEVATALARVHSRGGGRARRRARATIATIIVAAALAALGGSAGALAYTGPTTHHVTPAHASNLAPAHHAMGARR